jgi:hypothetical protein
MTRDLDGIAAIVLHPVAGLFGNQRRRDDAAVEALLGQVASLKVAHRRILLSSRLSSEVTCATCVNVPRKRGHRKKHLPGRRIFEVFWLPRC